MNEDLGRRMSSSGAGTLMADDTKRQAKLAKAVTRHGIFSDERRRVSVFPRSSFVSYVGASCDFEGGDRAEWCILGGH